MRDDPELQMDAGSPDDGTYSPKRGRIESDSRRLLPALIIGLFVLVFAGGIYYFMTNRPSESDPALRSKVASLEEKIAGLEKQIADLQGKPAASGADPFLVRRVEALSQKVEALEKRPEHGSELKKTAAPSKAQATEEKRYHTVKKGETLFGISRKYGMTVAQLRELNGLSRGQTVRTGQKLLVSAKQ